jgi:hypothetical protein
MSNQIRIIDKVGLFPETKGKARWVTVKSYNHAMEIIAEQTKLGNEAVIVFW